MYYQRTPNYTLKTLCNDTDFLLKYIKVICQKYSILCLSNQGMKSNFPSQGCLDVLVIVS